MSLSNAATYYDYFWQGTDKAEKHSARSGKTSLLVGFGGNDTLNGANKSDIRYTYHIICKEKYVFIDFEKMVPS